MDTISPVRPRRRLGNALAFAASCCRGCAELAVISLGSVRRQLSAPAAVATPARNQRRDGSLLSRSMERSPSKRHAREDLVISVARLLLRALGMKATDLLEQPHGA